MDLPESVRRVFEARREEREIADNERERLLRTIDRLLIENEQLRKKLEDR